MGGVFFVVLLGFFVGFLTQIAQCILGKRRRRETPESFPGGEGRETGVPGVSGQGTTPSDEGGDQEKVGKIGHLLPPLQPDILFIFSLPQATCKNI